MLDPSTGARLLALSVVVAGCGGSSASPDGPPSPPRYGQLSVDEFNRRSLLVDRGVYWADDANADAQVNPAELETLLFHPDERSYVENGSFTGEFASLYDSLVEGAIEGERGQRLWLVIEELSRTPRVLLASDLSDLLGGDAAFIRGMLDVAALVDQLFAEQMGMPALTPAEDHPSQALFRRNWGVHCYHPATRTNPACSASDQAVAQYLSVYPRELQLDAWLCDRVSRTRRPRNLDAPTTVVAGQSGRLSALPYTNAYASTMEAISAALVAARDALDDPTQVALDAYLTAVAAAFVDGEWEAADEAWATLGPAASRWYVRVAPDTLWDGCGLKAAFSMTVGRYVDPGAGSEGPGLSDDVAALARDLERQVAALTEGAFDPRDEVNVPATVLIDVLWNAGEARPPFGGPVTVRRPVWGPLAEDRAKAVEALNLTTSAAARRHRSGLSARVNDPASHRLFQTDPAIRATWARLWRLMKEVGPNERYRRRRRRSADVFGDELSATLHELRARLGVLFATALLWERGALDARTRDALYAETVVDAIEAIGRGVRRGNGALVPEGAGGALALWMLATRGSISWTPDAPAADGEQTGALSFRPAEMAAIAPEALGFVLKVLVLQDEPSAAVLVQRALDDEPVIPVDVMQDRTSPPHYEFAVRF